MKFDSEEQQQKMESNITSKIMTGFPQARDLISFSKSLKVPINPEFGKLILVDTISKIIKFKNITFRILGPTKKNLEKLRVE